MIKYLLENYSTAFATFLLTLLVFGLFVVGMVIGLAFGSYRRRCACKAAESVLKQVAQREKAARKAAGYDPETVDPNNLPILDDND